MSIQTSVLHTNNKNQKNNTYQKWKACFIRVSLHLITSKNDQNPPNPSTPLRYRARLSPRFQLRFHPEVSAALSTESPLKKFSKLFLNEILTIPVLWRTTQRTFFTEEVQIWKNNNVLKWFVLQSYKRAFLQLLLKTWTCQTEQINFTYRTVFTVESHWEWGWKRGFKRGKRGPHAEIKHQKLA